MKKANWIIILLAALLITSLVLAGCQPAAQEASAQEIEAEETNSEEGPTVGGTLVLATVAEPDTLDIYKSSSSSSAMVAAYIGGSLVTKNANGEIVPSLAESWDVSADGLTYTFHLRKDVKFHNEEPFTANDYIWTWDRCLAEDFICPVSASLLEAFVSYEATDDYTLVLTLAEPNYYTIQTLGAADYLQPLNRTAVEAAGENYGMGNAVGVGPFILKEWVQDEKIILTRNPDYSWGPDIFENCNTGPRYVENYEIRILPDLATILAGMQAGEIGLSNLEAKDVQPIKDNGSYQIFETLPTGIQFIQFNHQDPKFADLKVRQALNLAVDKNAVLQVVLNGQGRVLDGPLSPAMIGYNEETMQGSGYGFDLEAAKALLEEADFTYNADNMLLTPDGEPFGFTLLGTPDEQTTKVLTMLVDMWKSLGAAVEIEQLDYGILAPKVFGGDYETAIMGIGWPNADVMFMMLHSRNIGMVNFSYYSNPELDALLEKARSEINPAAHQEAVDAAYKIVVDEAVMLPLFTPYSFIAVNHDFQGAFVSPFIGLVDTNLNYTGE